MRTFNGGPLAIFSASNRNDTTYQRALKVHKVVTNLKVYSDKVDKGDVITLFFLKKM